MRDHDIIYILVLVDREETRLLRLVVEAKTNDHSADKPTISSDSGDDTR